MQIEAIEIGPVRASADQRALSARIVFRFHDKAGRPAAAHFLGKTERAEDDTASKVAERLVWDAYRQLVRMPEFRSGREEVSFADAVSLGAAA
ncbi:MAG: hypothetical protein D6688_07035 [Alphaproteobacteria bacterium]|nr:MAG: hypothetical protein D6688_07035 [Alphaproteobacteria bacterium]